MNRFIVIDIETTGNQPNKDAITQVGAVLIENEEIKKIYSSFVYTDQPIPEYIQALTGITHEVIKDAALLEDVMMELLPLMEGAIFVAHHAAFDLGFIQKALEKSGYSPFSGPVVDTLDLARILLPMVQSYKLGEMTQELKIKHENPHRAVDDALATAQLFLQLVEQLKKMPLIYLQRLYEITKNLDDDLAFFIDHFVEDRIIHPIEEDQFFVYQQMALQKIMDEDDSSSNEHIGDLEFEEMFSVQGFLSERFPNFEIRPSQKEMSLDVMEAFIEQKHLMIEAGTGTGKSLAYLIPSIFWAKEHNEKVVVSTHTINLQEQLYQRDIPVLKEILPFDFHATVLKGRNHYLCLRKFEQQILQSSSERNKEEMIYLAQLLTWVALTKTGDVEELNLSPNHKNLWNEVKSDAETCLNRNCPWFRVCFYHRAKQKAQTADLILTNHSLLLTDLQSENRILPNYKKLVIDEAHHFEDVASKHLGYELTQYGINQYFQRLYKDAKHGLLIQIMNECYRSQDPDQFAVANQIQNQLLPILIEIEQNFQEYFNQIGKFVDHLVVKQETGRKTLRITERIKSKKEWKIICEIYRNLYIQLTEMDNLIEETLRKLKDLQLEENFIADLKGIHKELKELNHILSEWNEAQDLKMVFWVETESRGKKFVSYLYASPIDVGPFIKEFLFDQKDSIILTSATLSVNGSFQYSSEKFGFDPTDHNLRKKTLSSPFDYRKQAIISIPNDFPNIQEVDEPEFVQYLIKNIRELVLQLNGKTLILFTSYQMLNQVYEELKKLLEPVGIKVLGHGIDSSSRTKLVKQFQSQTPTVLLGTSSFWEGVDIPGESLSALVIVRLPFTPPNHPIYEAKTEKLKVAKRNPFMEMAVPQAVIRFKQGFGRLIRTQKDRGVVIVFDRRIIESKYGKYFLQSLPDIDVRYQPFSKILSDTKEWIKKE
ncbi:ATP-dependent DNA helicase DinG [Tepidibacillus fermentans]|uniref:3'-5' exonuclease DinG n=1 Tax=Tepidibacillus fermentans TaxID=1281767 RepID=A0A4R3KK47_9BACI|nr:ATP-dependent DNA helicase DinG [Tepidibacillus fermentans]TCS84165.1 ATP-dependent DNA helicase DinG [Tepidibacillus fermentans]